MRARLWFNTGTEIAGDAMNRERDMHDMAIILNPVTDVEKAVYRDGQARFFAHFTDQACFECFTVFQRTTR